MKLKVNKTRALKVKKDLAFFLTLFFMQSALLALLLYGVEVKDVFEEIATIAIVVFIAMSTFILVEYR